MRRVALRSKCAHDAHGWHTWMCYSHDAQWVRLGLLCTRCGAGCTATAFGYSRYVDDAEKATLERISRLRQSPPSPQNGA